MGKAIVFMFSGQGSQYYHMGKELYHNNLIFRNSMLELNKIVFDMLGISVIEEIYNTGKTKTDRFDNILFTHPAIFMVEYSLAMVLIEDGIVPDYVLGASLGEFTAATVANVMPPEQAVKCILKQAELIRRYCQAGGMIAIIYDPAFYRKNPEIYRYSQLAAVNFDSHFVVSGEKEELSNIEEYLKIKGIPYLTLPVLFGFHSSYIDKAKAEYIIYLSTLTFSAPKIPILSCLYGGLQLNCITPSYFWDVVREPIRFQETIQTTCETHFNYIDLGPSGTLANFVKYNLSKDCALRVFDIFTPFDQEIKKLERLDELITV